MLKSIHLTGAGPVPNLSAEFAPRLNVLTGDNGLGKSFLLDIAFWALTGTWPGDRVALPEPAVGRGQQWDLLHPVHPPFGRRQEAPSIRYQIGTKAGPAQRPRTARFDYGSQTWARTPGKPAAAGLVIYAAANGSYCVWDPARNRLGDALPAEVNGSKGRTGGSSQTSVETSPRAYQFGPDKIDQPLKDGDRILCRGLVEDWTSWYYQKGRGLHPDPFSLLELVVRSISHPQEPMKPGLPRRVFVDNVVDYPTIEWLDRSVAYPHWPAGIRRVLSLAYLLVWSWSEHVKAAVLRGEAHTNQLVLIIDEVEAHLHPKWQRTIVPALLQVNQQLHPALKVQFLLATHSPLVMASLEPYFKEESDKLFWFDLQERVVHFREYPWAIQGDVVGWLTSEIFDLKQARSREAEDAIEAAKAFMRGDIELLPSHLKTREQIQTELERLLPGLDPFWPRWLIGTRP